MKSESRRSGSLLPRSGNFARRPPKGVSPCGIDDDVSHDTPALAFGVTVPFSRSHHSTPARLATVKSRQPSRQRRADTHPLPPLPLRSGVGRSVRVNPPGNRSPGGLEILRPGTALCKPGGDFSSRHASVPARGIERLKKTRKGKPRQHLAKVGTPAENCHTQHAAEQRRRRQLRGARARAGCSGRPRRCSSPIVAFSLLGWIFWFEALEPGPVPLAHLERPSPSTSAGRDRTPGSVTTSPSSVTAPCSILRGAFLVRRARPRNASGSSRTRRDAAVAQLADVGGSAHVGTSWAPRGP